jgi:general secretion pathway protein D
VKFVNASHAAPKSTTQRFPKLQIYSEVSAVDPTTANQQGGYTINKRSIQSTVLADNGSIIALGGLMNDNYSSGNSKVPGLANIPWIGSLFRSENKSRTKDNLMVFLRPVIVRDDLDSEAISANRYQLMRSQQLGYKTDNQVIKDNDVPVMPPAPPGSRDGADPAQQLFDLRDMTRQPALPAQSPAPKTVSSAGVGGNQ